jgi:hypothetical protein
MKESTKKVMDAAGELVEAADMQMDSEGFKYHSERTWVGFTTCGKVVVVKVPKGGKPLVSLYAHDENGLDSEPEQKPKKKRPKVNS